MTCFLLFFILHASICLFQLILFNCPLTLLHISQYEFILKNNSLKKYKCQFPKRLSTLNGEIGTDKTNEITIINDDD